jgi:hypothetical protein
VTRSLAAVRRAHAMRILFENLGFHRGMLVSLEQADLRSLRNMSRPGINLHRAVHMRNAMGGSPGRGSA